jgi:Na+-translocating ferredoxin:NAD+ oxidoreductase RNF subunit RnfB
VGVERADKLVPYGSGVNANKGETKMVPAKKDTIRQIYDLLPKLNCGFCGFGNCGQFAKAVAEGRASVFGCRQNPWVGYQISQITGAESLFPGYQSGFRQPVFVQRPASVASLKSLEKEVEELLKRADDALGRIGNLQRK